MQGYGIDIEKLPNLIQKTLPQQTGHGSYYLVASSPEYELVRLDIAEGKSVSLPIPTQRQATGVVEEGLLRWHGQLVGRRETIPLEPSSEHVVFACEATTFYMFQGAATSNLSETHGGKGATFDFRDKYWGTIETVVNAEYTGKRLFFRKGQHSSLHFHCAKTETYYIQSGCLLVRLRAGRGEDRFFELHPGDTLLIPPGLMHQDGALEDTVIIEVSTHDEDSDSFIVIDGQTQPMAGLNRGGTNRPGGKRIVFDLDGCLCTQTAGDYENANPIEAAVELVNRLYAEGHTIIIHTARFMGRNEGNINNTYYQGYKLTKEQLARWGVCYHELVMGKPVADVVVDDRGVFFVGDWESIYKAVRERLGEDVRV